MKIPRYSKKINNADIETKNKVEEIIKETLEYEYIHCYPIEDFNSNQLDILAEYAKENDVLAFIKAEHSNVHQGVLISTLRKDKVSEFIKYL